MDDTDDAYLPNRYREVLQRQQEQKIHVVSQHWSDAEDERLRMFVAQYGPYNWPFIACLLTQREPKQCRERWLYHLAPDIKKGKISQKEWATIQKLQRQLGNRWTTIAKFVPGRSPNQIKNCWHSSNRGYRPKRELKRKRERNLDEDKNLIVTKRAKADSESAQQSDAQLPDMSGFFAMFEAIDSLA